ncbi:hypothetical protein [Ancylobacter mangrovi]|uniref:CsbD family protein n=1 Tax=Ancylobacter mangrovi TaxID=2972472 RepID=A0A9X2PP04_9HYPH|nr:hypothetical protein [Ancylobacter mangrovi]MCS0497203.1 hypothetical protein [Ancylobacter mangrovi]MCS0505028.1 hypothetical protein [Ancylobacter mangrovi]
MDTHRITGAARQAGGRLRGIAGRAGHDAALRAEEAYEEAMGAGGRAFGDVRERTLALADDALESGHELYGRSMQALSRQAAVHPLALVVAAGLTGAAVAWFLSSGSRR